MGTLLWITSLARTWLRKSRLLHSHTSAKVCLAHPRSFNHQGQLYHFKQFTCVSLLLETLYSFFHWCSPWHVCAYVSFN